MPTSDSRVGKIIVVSHYILNVHSLEDELAEFPGFKEKGVLRLIIKHKVGMFQLPCPETVISHISRLPLPKGSYDNPVVRRRYRELAKHVNFFKQFIDKDIK
ncbi:hypothetical protein DRN87_03420 [Candidatus Geothermarchaeota archaeon]|nr:MAG: hypothetical protein DRN87_03420 [Candidatus Geothermarchaeota archaeon]